MQTFLIVLLVLLAVVLVAGAVLTVLALRRSAALGAAPKSRLAPTAVSEAQMNHAAESLSHVLHFRTVTQPDGEEMNDEFRRFHRYLELRYPSVHQTLIREELPGGSLVYCWKAREPMAGPVLLCAHQDVVPAQAEQWSHDPFAGELQDGWVYGRGALDCKNVLIAIMESLESLCSVGFAPSRDVWLAFGADEETGGSRGAASIAELLRQRGLRFDLVLDEGAAVRERYLGLSAPVALVGVGEKGMLNLKLTAKGTPGHASAPGKSTTLGNLAEAICRLEQRSLPAKLHPTVTRYLQDTAVLQPKMDRVLIANLPYTAPLLKWWMGREPHKNASVRTTFAPTMISGGTARNVLPQEASVIVNCRVVHGNTVSEVLSYVQELVQDLNITVETLLSKEPSAVSTTDCDAYRTLCQTIRDTFGPVPVVPVELLVATDSHHYESVSDHVYRFMPFVLDDKEHGRMHGVDERMSVEAMGRATVFYTQLLRTLSEGETATL